MNIVDRTKNVILTFTQDDPRILAVYILGSAYSNRMRPDSDIDLALLLEPEVTYTLDDKLKLSTQLSLEVEFTLTAFV